MSIKIFAHRGFINKKSIKENSLPAFENAFKNHFEAFELDIWYLENQLILSHGKPEKLDNLNRLEDLFNLFSTQKQIEYRQIEYWLDFKNLNLKNSDSAMKLVKKIAKESNIKLDQLYFAPFIVDLEKAKDIYQIVRNNFGQKVKILAVKEIIEEQNYHQYYQELKSLKIYGLSIQHKNINEKFRKIFNKIKIFAWTVNDKKTHDFLDKIGIENITSDKLIPKNLG